MKKKLLFPRSAKGQSLVELAISLVVLIYLLSGAAEFGVLFFQYVQLRDAAQEGALYGSTEPEVPADIETRARAASDKPINLTSGDVTVEISINGYPSTDTGNYAARACEGNALKVEVKYTHNIFMPFMPQLLGGDTIPLTATVTDTILSPYQTPSGPCVTTTAP